MTVSAQTPINRSTGNGVTTVFPYTFKIIADADIEVTIDDVVKTLNVDYTVSGAGVDAGGNVTMTTAPANSTSVVRRRNMSLTRTTDYQDQGELPAATLDSDIDATVLMIQQVDEQTSRAMLLPAAVTGFSTELPTPVADYFLRVNSAGTALELAAEMTPGALTVTPFIETLLNDSTAADARTTLGAAASGPLASSGITGAEPSLGYTAANDSAVVKLTGNQTIAGVKTFSSQPVMPAQSMVRLNTSNGNGSSSTAIRRFTNVVTNQGTDITYADSSTLGATFTTTVAGVYAISYSDSFTASNYLGISLNSAQLTTSVNSITASTCLASAWTPNANLNLCVAWTGYLASGAVIRAHTNVTPGDGTFGSGAHFTMARVA